MEAPIVEIISDHFIKPKNVSEETKKPIHFSPWDLSMISVNYIQKGLLFHRPKNQDFSITKFLQDLKDSLSTTLSDFHPLAARLSTIKQQNPPSLVIYLNPQNSPGARFIHSAINLTVADILTPIDVPLIVQSFFDHHKAIGHDGHEMSLLTVQVTELTDGIFLGCSINHMVVDGYSFWHFFNSLAEVFQAERVQNGHLIPISRHPIIQRWIPEGSDPIITLPFTNEDQFIFRPYFPLLRNRIFHFSSVSLAKLKAKVSSECNTTEKISSLQALSAVVWRCVTRARRLPADQETGCNICINNRHRLYPPLPENYFGNSVETLTVIARAGELLDHGVGWAAWQLHEAVVNHNDKAIREFVDSWVKNPFMYKKNRHLYVNSIHMGSSPRFNMYGNEFGLGKGVAVLSGYANKFEGMVTWYEGREGGGSMDLEVSLLPKNMEAFEFDEEFMSLAS